MQSRSGVASVADSAGLSLPAKLTKLCALVRDMDSVLVCYSGGIDSALVLAVATEQLAERAIGMTAVGPSLPATEQQDAVRIAAQLGAQHRLVESNELDDPDYAQNGPDRCYHCRRMLYALARRQCAAWNLVEILNGTNADDLGDYRPGLRAAQQAGVRSPLAEAGLSKADVRQAARLIGLDAWDKPAAACLSSRIPYGCAITRERLAQVGGFESALRSLGFRQLRVRWHESIARLEFALDELPRVLQPEVRGRVVEAGRQHGFTYVTLDLAGYRTGSLNELLEGRRLRVLD
jgi:uncharacterized protein